MPVDLSTLWDFSDPALSEQRFRDALSHAEADDRLILHTQIARSFGLRRKFDEARAVLAAIAPSVPAAGAEARTRYQLELGRTYASATHAPDDRNDAHNALARAAYEAALAEARGAALDGTPDVYVYEELEHLYGVQGDATRAAHYAARRRDVTA